MHYGLYLQTYIVVSKFCQVKLLYLSHPQHFERTCTHHPFLFLYFFSIKLTRRTNFPNFILSKKVYMFRAGSGSNLTLLGSCHQTCKEYTIAECTVDNSWWWAKERPERCRVFWQNKIWEIRASGWFCCKEICSDARSHERKIYLFICGFLVVLSIALNGSMVSK